MSGLSQTVLQTMQSVVSQNVALHEPCFEGNEWKYVKECIDTRWVSSAGKYVDAFEKNLAEFTGARFAVAVVNGTAALHVCLQLAGVERDDEVLAPDLTFIATANAIAYTGAIPHFVDSTENTLGLDPEKLDQYLQEVGVIRDGACYNRITGRRIRAIVPMHTFGHSMDLDPLIDVCEKYHLALVEDAAESLGTYYKGRHTGTFGRINAMSFNGNKIITTGGGGALLTNDESLGRLAKHITTTAKLPHAWDFFHDRVGYNYRMPNINAALGCAQLEALPRFLEQKRALAKRYQQAFLGVQGIRVFAEPEFSTSNYWLNVLMLDQQQADQRNDILQLLNTSGIMVRPAWILMHKLPMYKECPRMDLTIAESIESRLINVPSSVFL
jgi:perosamine synthetase